MACDWLSRIPLELVTNILHRTRSAPNLLLTCHHWTAIKDRWFYTQYGLNMRDGHFRHLYATAHLFEYKQMIDQFICQTGKSRLTIPGSLSSLDRLMVHQSAERRGLDHLTVLIHHKVYHEVCGACRSPQWSLTRGGDYSSEEEYTCDRCPNTWRGIWPLPPKGSHLSHQTIENSQSDQRQEKPPLKVRGRLFLVDRHWVE